MKYLLVLIALLTGCTSFTEYSDPNYQDSGCLAGPGERQLVPQNYVKRIEKGEADHCEMILTNTLKETVDICKWLGAAEGRMVRQFSHYNLAGRAVYTYVPQQVMGCWSYSKSYGVAPKSCKNTIQHEQAHCLGWVHPDKRGF